MTDPPFDLARAHRWFAVEFNNRAWDLVEARVRTAAEIDEMIHAAHAACLHWLQVGTVVNHLRAQSLLTCAYATAGRADAALRHAALARELSEQAGDEQTLFDRGSVCVGLAWAHEIASQAADTERYRQQALTIIDQLEDEADKAVLLRLLPPGSTRELR